MANCVSFEIRTPFSLSSTFYDAVQPQILPFTFGDDPLNTEDMAAVQCMALKGDLPIKISWYLNDKPIMAIESGIHVIMTTTRISQLTIESVTAYHRGTYRCLAENSAGYAEYLTELRVNGKEIQKHVSWQTSDIILLFPIALPQSNVYGLFTLHQHHFSTILIY